MKNLTSVSFANRLVVLVAIFAACLLSPRAAHGQFDPASGPYIDECSSSTLPTGGPEGQAEIEGTACVTASYDTTSSAGGYVEFTDEYYTLDDQPSISGDVQVSDPNGNVIYDTGYSNSGSGTWVWGSTDINPNGWYTVSLNVSVIWWGEEYDLWNLGGQVEVTPPVTGVQGIVYPKYVVVGVTYAPPGPSSYVQYQGTTSVGTTSTFGNSFSNGYETSISTTNGINIGKASPTTISGGVTITGSTSNSYTQTQNTSSSDTISKSTSISYKTNGYSTSYSPNGTPSPTLPNDSDLIWVWINPELIFTATPAYGSNPATMQFNGYAYDPYDQDYVDVAAIPVGCLNGDFTASTCSDVQETLDRSWVYTNEQYPQQSPVSGVNVTAPGCPTDYPTPVTQTAESPSICPNTQDAYNILKADPLAYIPGQSAYTGFNSQPLPSTTPDGRYTQLSGTGNTNPVQYVANLTEAYSATQMNTQTQSNGGMVQMAEKIEISSTASVDFFNVFKSSITYTNTQDMTQTNTWLNSLTTTQAITNAFSSTGSAGPNYLNGGTAPSEFTAYQDNLYGTFVLIPN